MITKQLASAFARGVNPADTTVLGWHGTSLHSFKILAQTGVLPVGINEQPEKYADWGIFMFPNPVHPAVRQLQFREKLFSPAQAVAEAEKFAKSISDRHRLMVAFGLDWQNHKHRDMTLSPMEYPKKMPPAAVSKALKGATSQGLVIAVDGSAAQHFRIAPGGDGDDVVVVCRGLPAAFVHGVEPVGEADYDFLDSLV